MATNASQTPVPAATTDGAPLPLVAVPQPELLTVNHNELPVLQNILGPGIHAVNLRLDIEHGEAVAVLRLEPGAELPIHYHTGPAEVYTIQGRWIYKEYPNQPQTAGSYIYEPAGTAPHTLAAPSQNTEDTVIFARITGALANFNPDGSFHSLLDASAIRALIDGLCAQNGVEVPRYINGRGAS